MQAGCERSEQAGAYVLGEMGSAELDDFARHLAQCEACADEVELLEAAADAVPLLATRPLGAMVPQSGSEVAYGAPPDPTSTDAETAYRPPHIGSAAPQADPRIPAAETKPLSATRSVRGPRLRALTGGIGSGARSLASNNGKGRGRFLQQPVPKHVLAMFGALAVAAIITAILVHRSNSIRYIAAQRGWTDGGALIKVQGSSGELLVEGMPKPPPGSRYQLWVLNKGTTALAPTNAYVHLNRRGEAGVQIPGDINDLVAIAAFEEPLSGPPTKPSGAVIVADLIPGTITNGS